MFTQASLFVQSNSSRHRARETSAVQDRDFYSGQAKMGKELGEFQTFIATDSGLTQALQNCIVTVWGLTQVPARGI